MAQQKPTAIIVAAGRGERFGGATRKQYTQLGGKPVLAWTLQAFESTSLIGDIVLVVHKRDMTSARRNIVERYGYRKVVALVEGGETRQASTWNGLQTVEDRTGVVLVHDGVRPLVDEGLIHDVLAAARKHGAAAAAIPESDTVVRTQDHVLVEPLDRSSICRMQTPQAFRFELLYEAMEALVRRDTFDATDESSIVHDAGHVVRLVPGRAENLKITTAEDLVIAEAYLRQRGDV